VAADRTLIGRYVLALPRAGAGDEAAVTATSAPPLSGGPGGHGSEATHGFMIAETASAAAGIEVVRLLDSDVSIPADQLHEVQAIAKDFDEIAWL
jgi:hypothetical protein